MKTRGTYPPDWPAIARACKEAAGRRCIRCGHPNDVGSGYLLTLTARPVCPIESDVARTAERLEVSEGIPFAASLQSEFAERNNVRHGQFFGKLVAMLAALLAAVAVPVARLVPLLSPIRTVVWVFTTAPMWALVAAKGLGEPPQATSIRAEAISVLARAHLNKRSAFLALITLASGLTRLRAVRALRHDRRRTAKRLTAFGAQFSNPHNGIIPYGGR